MLTISKKLNTTLGYSIIPIIYTALSNTTLFEFLSTYININTKYKSILEHIENNIKHKHVNIANITIELTTLHQLYIIIINDKTYSTLDNSELLEGLRIAGNTTYTILKNNHITKFNLIITLQHTTEILALLEGLLLSSYKFTKYKTTKTLKQTTNYTLQTTNIILTHGNITKSILAKLSNIVKSVFLARDLINEPANTNKATRFITMIREYIKKHKLPINVEILKKRDIQKLGMGLILGVGQASNRENEPQILILKYLDEPEYVLLGKGVTFDTGGLNLKSGKSMLEMKSDLSGAATVCSFLLGYAMNKGSKSITCICPFVENTIGPNAIKPSDVLTAYNGTTVEITNTDAEGRLILADCLAFAVDKYPQAQLIDFATLTGQQETLSSKLFSNVLSVNSDLEVEKMIKSSKEINELLVPLPIIEKELPKLESYTADLKNVSFSSSADLILSSLFMRQFIKKNTKWIHIDIAGPSFNLDNIVKYTSPEASGIGVRLLFNYFS